MKRCNSCRRNTFCALIAGRNAPKIPQTCFQWAAVVLLAGGAKSVFAQQVDTFDPSFTGPSTGVPQDGSGTWDGVTADWYNSPSGTAGGSDVIWPNDGVTVAQFGNPSTTTSGLGGTAGTVNLAENISAGGLILNQPASGNYTINAASDNLALESNGLIVSGGSPTIAVGNGEDFTNIGVTTIGNSAYPSTSLTMSGLGTWSTAPGGSTSFVVGGGSNASLQMTNLANFVFNNPTFSSPSAGGEFDVGVQANGVANVTLAATSSITAAIVRVGDSEGTSGSANTSTLNLGSGSATIDAGVINIGGGSITGQGSINGASGTPSAQIDSGVVQFAGATGSLTIGPIAGASGAQALGPFINIGVGGSGTTNVSGTLNLDGHNVNINAASLDLGQRISGSGNSATGVLSFDTGTINVGTVYMSHVNGSSSGGTGTSTLNIGSSTASTELFDVNGSNYVTNTDDFTLASANTTSSTAYFSNSVININGGTALINSNMYASHTGSLNSTHATINLQGGTLNMNRNEIGGTGDFVTFNATSGTLENVGAINRSSGISAGLVKTGTGTLTLLGTNTWTNQTTINAGTLVAGAADAMAPNASVDVSIGLLDVSQFANIVPSLTVNSSGTLNLGIGNLLTDNGAATFGGTLNVSGTASGSSIELMSYTSETGVFASVPTIPGYTLEYTPTELELVQGLLSLTWNNAGASAPDDGKTWDTTSNNWNNGANATTYADGSFVTFNDANNATSNGGTNPNAYNVTLNSTVSPGSLTVNNSLGNYTFTGTGSIAGSTSLIKNGTGTLSIGAANTYTGGTQINSGGVVINSGGTLGASTNTVTLGTSAAALGSSTTPVATLTLNTNVMVGSFASQTNNSAADVITIAPNASLTDSGNFIVGPVNNNTNSTNYTGALTAAGGGSLTIAGSLFVAQASYENGGGGKDTTAANLSGLNSVSVNNITGTVGVGDYANSLGVLILADTTSGALAPSNFLNAAELDVGNTQAFNDAGTSTLTLGSGTNTIEANSINIGFGKTGGIINWSSDSTSSSSLVIEGTGGNGALANITLGQASAGTYTNGELAQLLLAGHFANVQTNTLIVGDSIGNSANGPNASVTFDTGTFSAQSVEIAADTGGTSTTGPISSITVGGASPNTTSTGTFTIGSQGGGAFDLGVFTGSATAAETSLFTINSGTVNIYSNIVVDNTSASGTVTSTLTLAGNGVLNMEGNRIGNNGGQGSGDMPITTVNLAPNATDTPTLENLGSSGINNAGLTMNGLGILILAGSNTYTGPTNVSSGTLLVANAGALPSNTAATITGGTLKLATSTGLATLSSLTISGTGALDLTNNHVIINYNGDPDPMSTIYSYLKSGYNNGAWNGPGIISSQIRIANANPNSPQYGIGFSDGNDKINGHSIVSGLSSGQIELKYTLLGDANLDGTVNGADFSILAANFGQGYTNWDQGNFLFSPAVNGADFSALAHNFGQGDSGADAGVTQADIAALDSFAVANGLPLPAVGAVPEPVAGGLLVGAGFAMLARRRRRVD
jgi:fibronectin-binding autotransporter adhesin